MAKQVTDADFQEEVLNSEIPVLVDFWAPWCGPCQMIGPIIEGLGTQYEGKCKVVKYDVQDHQEFAAQYGIQGIPAMKIFKGGEIVGEIAGAVPKDKIVELIESNL